MAAPSYGWSIDTIGRVERNDITFLPVKNRSQPLAKFDGGAADLSIGVRAINFWLEEDYLRRQDQKRPRASNIILMITFLIWEFSVFSFEEKIPKIGILDLERGVQGLERHSDCPKNRK